MKLSLRKKRKVLILIVDDTVSSHQMFSEIFKQNGFEVMLLKDAEGSFSEIVGNLNPDIISMDLMFGNEGVASMHDGFQAMEQLKADPRTKDIPIIVLTNFFEESKVQRAKELGAVDFINLSGQPIQKIPAHYVRYLDDPKNYKPSHPAFRKG